MPPAIIQVPESDRFGYRGYGAVEKLWNFRGPEAILTGPYETGKTLGALHKLNALLCKYAGARALMVRRTYTSLVSSAAVTFEEKVLAYPPGHHKCPIEKLGKSRPEMYFYPNGSSIVLGGLDNPSKFLSAEFDYIYVNQAEEILLNDWEVLTGRATGRAGHAPYAQVIGDCNPGPPNHWILRRDRLTKFTSDHKDNPALWDRVNEQWTPQGKKTLETLDALTGLRYKRGRLGLWVAAEGQVYEYDPAVHVVPWFPIPREWTRFRVIDFGYQNPFVCQWWAIDHDGRLYLYREIYHTQRTVSVHSKQINELSGTEVYAATVCDHDAEDRATLAENGIPSIAATKAITVGIEEVEERLKVDGSGKPRLFILQHSLVEVDPLLLEAHKPTCTDEEFPNYVYPPDASGRPLREVPVDLDNHGMDCVRYAAMYAKVSSRSLFAFGGSG